MKYLNEMDWNDIFKFLISASTITAAIVYIGKRIIDKSLDLGLEKYKAALALELETHKIKLGKLHGDRILVIRSLQADLYKLEKVLYHLTTTYQDGKWLKDDERESKAMDELNGLKESMEIDQIYLSEGLCNRIYEFIEEGKRFVYEMNVIRRDERVNEAKMKLGVQLPIEESTEPIERWLRLEKAVQVKIRAARSELTNDFRIINGVGKD